MGVLSLLSTIHIIYTAIIEPLSLINRFKRHEELTKVIKKGIEKYCAGHSQVVRYDELVTFMQTPEVKLWLEKYLIDPNKEQQIVEEIECRSDVYGNHLIAIAREIQKEVYDRFEMPEIMILSKLSSMDETLTAVHAIVSETKTMIQAYTRDQEVSREVLEKADETDTRHIKFIEERVDETKVALGEGNYEKANAILTGVENEITLLSDDLRAEYFNSMSCIYLGMNRPNKALEYIQKALETNPTQKYKSNEIISLIATETPNNIKTAKGLLVEYEKEFGKDSRYYYAEGILYAHINDFESAINSMKQSTESESDYLIAQLNLAGYYLLSNRNEELEEQLAIIEELTSGGQVSREILFHKHFIKGNRLVYQILRETSLYTPDEEGMYTTTEINAPPEIKEIATRASDEFDKALYYAQGIEKYQMVLNKSFCQIVNGDYLSAKSALESLPINELTGEMKNVVLTNLGNVYSILGEYDNAIPIFERLISEFGETKSRLMFLAGSLVGLGPLKFSFHGRDSDKVRRGLEIYEELAERYPDNLEIQNNLSVLYFQLGENDKAERILKKIEKIAPTPETYRNLGSLYKGKGDYESAYDYYKRLYESDKDDITSHLLLGEALAYLCLEGKQTEYIDSAIELLERSIAQLNGFTEPLILLTELYNLKEDWDKASKTILKILDKAKIDVITAERLKHNFNYCQSKLGSGIYLPVNPSFFN